MGKMTSLHFKVRLGEQLVCFMTKMRSLFFKVSLGVESSKQVGGTHLKTCHFTDLKMGSQPAPFRPASYDGNLPGRATHQARHLISLKNQSLSRVIVFEM